MAAPNAPLETQVNRNSSDYEKNSRRMAERLNEIKEEEERIRQGGGARPSSRSTRKAG